MLINEIYQETINRSEEELSGKDLVVHLADSLLSDKYMLGFVQAEIERLKDRQKRLENKISSTEDRMIELLTTSNFDLVECARYTIKTQLNPVKVEIDDNSLIPPEYWKTKTVQEIDKLKLKEEMAMGVYIPGARLYRHRRLIIK